MAKRFTLDELNTKDEVVLRAYNEFMEYHNETQMWRLERMDNQRFYNVQNKDHLKGVDATKDPSTVIHSTVESLVADCNDSFPEPYILPQEKNDRLFAEQLSAITRHVLDKREYDITFTQKNRRLCIDGLAIQEVYWDKSLYNGLGDVNIRPVNAVNFYWDTHTDDIQEGRSVIKVAYHPKEWYASRYGKDVFEHMVEGRDPVGEEIHEYVKKLGLAAYDDTKDVMLMEYWFKECDEDNPDIKRVHVLKIAGGRILEDSRKKLPEGMYDDGMYPFIAEPQFQVQGHAHGLSVVDIFKRRVITLDRLNQYIIDGAGRMSKSRHFVEKDAEVDMEALRNEEEEIIFCKGISTNFIQPFTPVSLPPWIRDWLMVLTEELKSESGQNDFSRGNAGKGITAASAITLLQEASSKRSRLLVTQLYSGFRKLVSMVISRIAQFYTEDRTFYILGIKDEELTLNASMFTEGGEREVERETPDGIMERIKERRTRPFAFDVNVQAQTKPPYQRMQKNQLAIELLQMSQGQFPLQAAIEMMDFEGKDQVLKVLGEETQKDVMIQQLMAQLEQFQQQAEQIDPYAQQEALALLKDVNQGPQPGMVQSEMPEAPPMA